jgi:exonuclease III
MSYITLRGCWCDVTALNVHAPAENKSDDMKNSFYKELEHVFDQFLNHMKILLGDINAKVEREDIFKPIIRNESLCEISKDNGVRVINFATSKSPPRVRCSTLQHS